jgi:hypothetical protein
MRIKAELDKAATNYTKELQKIADQVFWKFVVPFCRTHNLRFVSKNGDYFFFPFDGSPCWRNSYSEGNNVPQLVGGEFGTTKCQLKGAARVVRALETPIPLYYDAAPAYATGIHSFMKEYTPHKKARKNP